MTVGWYISGVAHGALFAGLLFGGWFARDPLPPLVVADVTVITEEQFAALTRPEEAPEVTTDAAAPQAPVVDTAPVAPPEPEVAPETAEAPTPETPEAPETPPEAPQPLPQNDIAAVVDAPPVVAPPTLDVGAATQAVAPAPAPRVAPEMAPPSPPEAESAPDVVEETAPSPDADEVAQETETAAPEEATTEIVTEAEQSEQAPQQSIRPTRRPDRPLQQADAPVEQTPTETDAAVQAALDAAARTASRPTPSGPPLTGGEKDALRIAVQQCWVVDVGSQSANVTVTVGVDMTPDGKVVGNQVRQISASGGDATAQRAAFEKARRAILRCQGSGFPLPRDKYDQWRQIEMTFNPDGMRLK
ncbi:MAG: hypothetical protein AAFR35_00695 [Pseudomonadota bacterium]